MRMIVNTVCTIDMHYQRNSGILQHFTKAKGKMIHRFMIKSRIIVAGNGCSPLIEINSKTVLRSLSTAPTLNNNQKKGLPRTSAGGDNLLPVSLVT
jgi:hypothetical protein